MQRIGANEHDSRPFMPIHPLAICSVDRGRLRVASPRFDRYDYRIGVSFSPRSYTTLARPTSKGSSGPMRSRSLLV